MKNIIILTATPIWSIGNGTGAPSCFNTIQGFQQNGWETHLIVPYSLEGISFNGVHTYETIHAEHTIGKNRLIKFIENYKYSKRVESLLKKKANEVISEIGTKDLIIYAYEVHAVLAARQLSAKYNIPLVTRFQGTIMYAHKDNLINRIGYYPHYQALSTKSDLLIMTNDGTFGDKYLEQIRNDSPIMFLRNGVDIDLSDDKLLPKNEIYKRLNLTGNEIVLMTLSRLANWKRIDRSIIAFSKIAKSHNDCRLVIIGDGDERQNLEHLAEELNIRNGVIFAGSIPQKEVASYLQIADIFLSLYDLGNAGNPTFEAMECGKTIIALNTGNTSEILENNKTAILIESNELDTLPQKIDELLNNSGRCKELGDNAKQFAKANFYSWDDRIRMECEAVEALLQ